MSGMKKLKQVIQNTKSNIRKRNRTNSKEIPEGKRHKYLLEGDLSCTGCNTTELSVEALEAEEAAEWRLV